MSFFCVTLTNDVCHLCGCSDHLTLLLTTLFIVLQNLVTRYASLSLFPTVSLAMLEGRHDSVMIDWLINVCFFSGVLTAVVRVQTYSRFSVDFNGLCYCLFTHTRTSKCFRLSS